MSFAPYQTLSFDCYGTLIDWEAGILAALKPLRDLMGTAAGNDDQVLAAFAEAETAEEHANPGLRYSALLARVHVRLAKTWKVDVPAAMHERFGNAIPDWPPFPDSKAALAELRRHAKLIILSNVDRVSFAASNKKLGEPFAAVYTAENIGSYKPDPRNFEYLLRHAREDLGITPDRLLHVAQSLFHDHVPAKAAGLATVWIDRRQGRGGGATQTPANAPKPDHSFASMADFAKAFTQGR
jgi:2-haloacid dehalogenase